MLEGEARGTQEEGTREAHEQRTRVTPGEREKRMRESTHEGEARAVHEAGA